MIFYYTLKYLIVCNTMKFCKKKRLFWYEIFCYAIFWYKIFLTIGTWSLVSQRLWVGRSALEVALQAGMQSMSLPMFSKPILGTFLTSWDQTQKGEVWNVWISTSTWWPLRDQCDSISCIYFCKWVGEWSTDTDKAEQWSDLDPKKYPFSGCLHKSLDILQSWADPGLWSDF